jgi:hypothetical protein
MMRPSSACVTAFTRQVRRICQLKTPLKIRFTIIGTSNTAGLSPGAVIKITNRNLSVVRDEIQDNNGVRDSIDGMNGESSTGNDIIESAAATMLWKRNQFRKLEDKFRQLESDASASAGVNSDTKIASTNRPNWPTWPTDGGVPLAIDKYDDVQPMWKGMESRVTKRKSLTLTQRGGVSGRRNVRRSDEDMWLEAGVYDDDKNKSKNE